MSDEMSSEVVETTDLEVATAALESLIASGGSEEDMIVELIGAGFKFARAGKLMNAVLESRGIRMSAKDRFAAVEELLVAWDFATPENWDEVETLAASISEEVDATTKAQAISAIRKYAKQNEIELPTKPKGTVGGGTRSSKFDRFYSEFRGNLSATPEDVVEWVNTLEASEKQNQKYIPLFQGILGFAQTFTA